MKCVGRAHGARWWTFAVWLALVGCGLRGPTGLAKMLTSERAPQAGGVRDLRELVTPPWAGLLAVWGEPDLFHASISGAAFLPDAKLVTFGGGWFKVWDLKTRRLVKELEPCPVPERIPGSVATLRYPHHSAMALHWPLVALGDVRGEICVRRLTDGAIVQRFQADGSPIRYLAFWGPGRLVSYAHRLPEPPTSIPLPNPCIDPRVECPPPRPDGNLRLWDLSTGKSTGHIHLGDGFSDPGILRSPDGSRLVGRFQGKVQCIELSTMTRTWTKPGTLSPRAFVTGSKLLAIERTHDQKPARMLELFAADGSEGRSIDVLDTGHFRVLDVNQRARVAAVFMHETLVFWDTTKNKRLGSVSRYEWPGDSAPIDAQGGVFSEDASVLATWSGGTITLWDVARREPLQKGYGHLAAIRDLEFSRDGSGALSTSRDGTIRAWRVQDGAELFSWPLGRARASFSPDASRVLLGVEDTVSVRPAERGQVVWEVDGRRWDEKPIYSDDGSRVATVSKQGGITMHDANTGEELWHHDQQTSGRLFTPDGKTLIGMQDMKMVLWNAETGQRVRQLWKSWHEPRFDADGRLLFVDAHQHALVRLPLDGARGSLREAVVWGHPVLIAPDGNRVFSRGPGGTLRLLRLGEVPAEDMNLSAFGDTPSTLALSPDGTRLLVGTERGLILHLAVGPAEERTGKAPR